MPLAKHIAAKLKADGLTPAQGAIKAGITAITFKAVLAGKSVPNKRSLPKYAKFLGLSPEQTLELAGNRAGKGGKKKGKGKAKGKRGRPPGKGKAKGKPGKRGRPPMKGVSPGKLKPLAKQVARAQKVLTKLTAAIAKLAAKKDK